jgi:hypothetical protein
MRTFVGLSAIVALCMSSMATAETPYVIPKKYIVFQGAPADAPSPTVETKPETAAAQPAQNSEQVETPFDPILRKYQPSNDVERAAAVSGNHNVIFPLFLSAVTGGNQSFIRFPNNDPTSSTAVIRIVGYPSQRELGAASLVVAGKASPQYSIEQIIEAAGAVFPAGEEGFALYITTSGDLQGLQHVIFNPNTKFFENVSVCQYLPGVSYPSLNVGVINAHSSRMTALGYPGTIMLYNKQGVAGNYTLRVYDSVNGALLGSRLIATEPNTGYSIPVSALEQFTGVTPTTSQFHYNITFTDNTLNPPNAQISHFLVNEQFGALINMTLVCPANY